eukprot:4385039-Amphidinium_carterae.1
MRSERREGQRSEIEGMVVADTYPGNFDRGHPWEAVIRDSSRARARWDKYVHMPTLSTPFTKVRAKPRCSQDQVHHQARLGQRRRRVDSSLIGGLTEDTQDLMEQKCV